MLLCAEVRQGLARGVAEFESGCLFQFVCAEDGIVPSPSLHSANPVNIMALMVYLVSGMAVTLGLV